MSEIYDEYKKIIQLYILNEISIEDLSSMYIDKFKNEDRDIPENEFSILDEIFSYIDSYTKDPQLILENSEFYIDEAKAKSSILKAINRLS